MIFRAWPAWRMGAVVLLIGASVWTTAAAVEWAPATPLNTNAATDGSVGDYYPRFAGDGQGHWVCVWCAAVPGANPRDFDIYVARSADNGVTWTDPVRLDPFALNPPEIEDDFRPIVATDGAGHWIAAWYSFDDHGGTIGSDPDILVSRSTDNGATWTSSVPLNADAAVDQDLYSSAADYEPALAYVGEGHWIAIWSKTLNAEDDADLYIAHSTDHGATWSQPALLHASMATDTGSDWSPTIGRDGAGNFVVAWASDDPLGGTIGTDDDILYSRSTDGLAWTAPAPLNSDAGTDGALDDGSPRITTDGAGRWVTVWQRGTYGVVDDDIMIARSDDAGATWTAPAYLNANAATDTERDRWPVPATDGNGGWVVVWYSKNSLGLPIGTDDNIQFAFSADNAATWSAPGVLNSYATDPLDYNYDWNPEVAYAGAGRWLSVWYSQFNLGGTIGADWDLMRSAGCWPLSAGDHDCDGDVDLDDFGAFQACYAAVAPFAGGCGVFDVDNGGAVDLIDFAALYAAFTGPGN